MPPGNPFAPAGIGSCVKNEVFMYLPPRISRYPVTHTSNPRMIAVARMHSAYMKSLIQRAMLLRVTVMRSGSMSGGRPRVFSDDQVSSNHVEQQRHQQKHK